MSFTTRKMEVVERFMTFPGNIIRWIKKYDSELEESLVKQVPLTQENLNMIENLKKYVPIVRRYRGSRAGGTPGSRECRKVNAKRVSIYVRQKFDGQNKYLKI